jgi:hypothetical protein
MMTFQIPLPEVATWGYTTSEGVEVFINNFESSRPPQQGAQPSLEFLMPVALPTAEPTRILLHAETSTAYEVVHPAQIRLPDAPREAAERALSEMGGVLGLLSEAPWTLSSPRPYLMVSAESDEERETLRATKRIVLPPWRPAPAMHGQGLRQPLNVSQLLSDRPDGVLLLGAATGAGRGVAKLHELFRVFENGFGTAGGTLLGPLTTFLQSYPDWDLEYSRDEVRHWSFELRHPATHADLKWSTRIAYDSDVERYLYRIEQAAYDVLFNKENWNRSDCRRLMRWAFSAAQRLDGETIVTDSARLRTSASMDHFGSFPLAEGILLHTDHLDENWLMGDWYFSEKELASFTGSDEPGDVIPP